jgi:hypothetical protein
VEYRGMDGVPAGIKPESAEAVARAIDVPWSAETVERLQAIEHFWKSDIDQRVKEEMDKVKK